MNCIIMIKKNFKNMFLFEKKNKFLDWHIFHYHVFTYLFVLLSSNQNELIWTKLRQTMLINPEGYPLSCTGTCIVVNDVHCALEIRTTPSNGQNLSFEVNHVEPRSSCWNPWHLYPAVRDSSVFIAIRLIFSGCKTFSSADEDT